MRQMTFVSPFQSPFVKPFPSEAVVAAAFDPLTLSPSLWLANRTIANLYQDETGSTPITTDGQAIGRSSDISGNNNHANQPAPDTRPAYKTGIKNGLSVARYDSGDYWTLTSSITLTTFTFFYVGIRPSAITSNGIIGQGATYGIRLAGDSTIRYISASGSTTIGGTWGANWYIGAVIRNGTALSAWNNGSNVTSGSPTNASGFTLDSIGRSTAVWGGDIGEILIFPSALSSGDMANMFTYLNGLWAVY